MKRGINRIGLAALAALIMMGAATAVSFAQTAYLEITLTIDAKDRPAAGAIYAKYKPPFLATVPGAISKNLLVREDDIQVLHGFRTVREAQAYLKSDLFNKDVVTALKPLLKAAPEIRIYESD